MSFFNKYKALIPVILTLAVFLFYLVIFLVQEGLITEDGTLWISYGKQIFQGDLHTFQFDGGAPSFSPLVFAPGYPFLIGLVNVFIGNPIFSAYLISMVLGALLCLVVFYISRELFNGEIATIALLLCGVYTGMKYYAVSTWIRSTGMFFLLLGLYLFIRSLRKGGKLFPLLTGLTLGAALLVRFEFALYAVLAAVLFLISILRKKLRWTSLFSFSAAVVVVYALYAVPLYLNSGYKLLSPYISDKFLGEKIPDKPHFNRYDNTDLAIRTILFNQNTASSYNLSKQNNVKVSKEDWETYGSQVSGPSIWSRLINNYRDMLLWIFPLLFKWHIVGFFLLGVYYSIRKRKRGSFGVCALIGLTLLLYPLGSIESIRYYHHLQPLLLIIASAGIYFVAEFVKNKLKTGAVFYAVIAGILGLYIINDVTKSLDTSYKPEEVVWLQAAEFLKNNAERDSILITRNYYPAFYGGLRLAVLPDEQNFQDVWEYSNHIGADWLIIDKQLTDNLMTQYQFLLGDRIPDYLELKKELSSGTEYTTRIFKIKHQKGGRE